MSDMHSIWLMPVADDLKDLQIIVDDLATRFDTPRFCPHLTLVEDMPRQAADLASVLESRFADLPELDCPITGVDGLPLYFRSLFAAFSPGDPLRALKSRAVTEFGTGQINGFMPHISLAYGATDDQKTGAFAALRHHLIGRRIRFGSIAVVASAQSIPIADWAIVHSVDLV